MSRTIRNHKLPGFEYWGRRLGNKYGLNGPGKNKAGKRKTHTIERAENRELINELKRIDDHFDNISSEQLLYNLKICGLEI